MALITSPLLALLYTTQHKKYLSSLLDPVECKTTGSMKPVFSIPILMAVTIKLLEEQGT
jgi:hypothetical protein